MSEFSDRPFVAGSLIGLRAFGVDKYGRLHGPSYKQVFRPGENVAECRKSEENAWLIPSIAFRDIQRQMLTAYAYPRYYLGGDGALTVEQTDTPEDTRRSVEEVWDEAHAINARVDAKAKAKREHTIGTLDCSCGFYAYFDGQNDYKGPDRVSALIEGYGVCTVGLRGFRAEKARLVAIITPKRLHPSLWSFVQRNYPDVPIFDRKREALEMHPLTMPEGPTPADADFWTRAVSA